MNLKNSKSCCSLMYETGDSIIDRHFKVPITVLWQAWTAPKIALQWFGSDPDGRGISANMEVCTGGNFSVTFRDSNGTEHTCFGTYTEVLKPLKLAFTWNWKSEPGVESNVSVTLSGDDDDTLMHFEHADVGEASAHNYMAGWGTTFDKLEKLLEEV